MTLFAIIGGKHYFMMPPLQTSPDEIPKFAFAYILDHQMQLVVMHENLHLPPSVTEREKR